MIAISYPTIMDGLVVRWYRTEQTFRDGVEAASASRNGIFMRTDDADLATVAQDVHLRIAKSGHDADLSDVLTHRTRLFSDELIPLSERSPR